MFGRINWRNIVAFLHDVAAAAAAWVLGYLFRFNFEIYEPYTTAMLSNLAWVVPVQAAIFLWLRMYRGLWRYASLPDLRRILVAAVLGAMAIAVGVVLLRRPDVPRSVLVLYPLLLATIMGGSRIAYRAWKEGHLSRIGEDGKRVIILGAGTAAANLLKNLGRSREWHFIGLLDDDPTKQRREIQGRTGARHARRPAQDRRARGRRGRGDRDAGPVASRPPARASISPAPPVSRR